MCIHVYLIHTYISIYTHAFGFINLNGKLLNLSNVSGYKLRVWMEFLLSEALHITFITLLTYDCLKPSHCPSPRVLADHWLTDHWYFSLLQENLCGYYMVTIWLVFAINLLAPLPYSWWISGRLAVWTREQFNLFSCPYRFWDGWRAGGAPIPWAEKSATRGISFLIIPSHPRDCVHVSITRLIMAELLHLQYKPTFIWMHSRPQSIPREGRALPDFCECYLPISPWKCVQFSSLNITSLHPTSWCAPVEMKPSTLRDADLLSLSECLSCCTSNE